MAIETSFLYKQETHEMEAADAGEEFARVMREGDYNAAARYLKIAQQQLDLAVKTQETWRNVSGQLAEIGGDVAIPRRPLPILTDPEQVSAEETDELPIPFTFRVVTGEERERLIAQSEIDGDINPAELQETQSDFGLAASIEAERVAIESGINGDKNNADLDIPQTEESNERTRTRFDFGKREVKIANALIELNEDGTDYTYADVSDAVIAAYSDLFSGIDNAAKREKEKILTNPRNIEAKVNTLVEKVQRGMKKGEEFPSLGIPWTIQEFIDRLEADPRYAGIPREQYASLLKRVPLDQLALGHGTSQGGIEITNVPEPLYRPDETNTGVGAQENSASQQAEVSTKPAKEKIGSRTDFGPRQKNMVSALTQVNEEGTDYEYKDPRDAMVVSHQDILEKMDEKSRPARLSIYRSAGQINIMMAGIVRKIEQAIERSKAESPVPLPENIQQFFDQMQQDPYYADIPVERYTDILRRIPFSQLDSLRTTALQENESVPVSPVTVQEIGEVDTNFNESDVRSIARLLFSVDPAVLTAAGIDIDESDLNNLEAMGADTAEDEVDLEIVAAKIRKFVTEKRAVFESNKSNTDATYLLSILSSISSEEDLRKLFTSS